MKYLSDYTQDPQTEAFERLGAFFAFSQEQLEEKRKPNVIYCALGAGLICPKENAQALLDELEAINKRGIEQDIAENGVEAIIRRELNNHECFYTGDVSDCVDALESYGIGREQIVKQFGLLHTEMSS